MADEKTPTDPETEPKAGRISTVVGKGTQRGPARPGGRRAEKKDTEENDPGVKAGRTEPVSGTRKR